MLRGPRNLLYGWMQRHPMLSGLALGLSAAAAGAAGGAGPEAALVGSLLGWFAWESRPNLYFVLGAYSRAAQAAASLAAGAGPSLRGDVHRLTQAAACLALGQLQQAKGALAGVDAARLPPRGRFVHFLNLSALYCRLGDGEAALAMVDAAQAEADELGGTWRGVPAINRAAALFELGRYQEALEDLSPRRAEGLPQAARPYFLNNMAWALALSGTSLPRAVRFAEKAVAHGQGDPIFLGTLAVTRYLDGADPAQVRPLLERSLARLDQRSPQVQAVLLGTAAEVFDRLGLDEAAADADARRRQLPGGGHQVEVVRRLLEARGEAPAQLTAGEGEA